MPQMIQRGFGRITKKSYQVIVYGRDGTVFPTSTAGYGAERDFYADGDDFIVDDLITEYENDIHEFYRKLVEADSEALQNRALIAGLIAHLELRSHFFREHLSERVEYFGAGFQAILSNPSKLSSMLASALAENPDILSNGIKENIGDHDLIEPLAKHIGPTIEHLIKINAKRFSKELSERFIECGMPFFSDIRRAHLRAVGKEIGDPKRKETYIDLNYTVHEIDDAPLILPDTMVAFCSIDRAIPFLDKGFPLDHILLPLTSKRILIGSKKKPLVRPAIVMNKILASTSFTRFIADRDDERLRRLTSRIGRNASILTNSDINRILRKIIQ